ncbi:hypothetical protein STCU_10418 [Strigomonas culicis]|uniref:DUF306 domain-containing protein n=1 Tax=Strigomonas culicis TaxID=28005 RepID=S9V4F2_9TRYP|nr:hypothetical protein STCU_10418 [Strigomonas culicis]|eukprot:EPY17755.1 hypothetical protein STCU_10418 [Strigomonas culicis]
MVGNYKVELHDGDAIRQKIILELSLLDQDSLEVHTKVANTLNGKWIFTDGMYKGLLMSTRMMAPPDLVRIEGFLSMGCMEGLDVKKDGDKLVLNHAGSTLVLARQ